MTKNFDDNHPIVVVFSPLFKQCVKNYPKADQLKIGEFVEHLQNYGFAGLQGRNKSSDNVPTDDPNWAKKVAFVQQYSLWHYHIGIPSYTQTATGELTSEYVLHYRLLADRIVIVGMSAHPPFELPTENELH